MLTSLNGKPSGSLIKMVSWQIKCIKQKVNIPRNAATVPVISVAERLGKNMLENIPYLSEYVAWLDFYIRM